MSSLQADLLERQGYARHRSRSERTQRRLEGNLQNAARIGCEAKAQSPDVRPALDGGIEEMRDDDIRKIVDEAVKKSILEILQSFGLEEGERKELQLDLSHLRHWRKSVEQAQSYTFKIVITTIVTGFLGAIWLGIQSILHK